MALLLHMIYLRMLHSLRLIRYRTRLIKIAFQLHPIAGGAGEGEGDGDGDGDRDAGEGDGEDDQADDEGDDSAKGDGDDDGAGDAGRREPNWKQMSRKHEREAKKARDEAEKLRKQLKAREDLDKSEQEKKIEEAEQRAREETTQQYETERRHDRLELATTKLAAKGITVGQGKDAATLKFADPDDAIVYLERAISQGDVDEEDVFDDKGRVRSDQLEEALADLLEHKPHLAANDRPGAKVNGSADGGKGGPAKGDGSVDDHLQTIRRHSSSKGEEGARYRRAA